MGYAGPGSITGISEVDTYAYTLAYISESGPYYYLKAKKSFYINKGCWLYF